jgi:hypothetical protein
MGATRCCSCAASGWKGSASNGVSRWLVCFSEACGFGHRSRNRDLTSSSVKYRELIRVRSRWDGRGTRLLLRNGGTPLSCLQASQRRNVSTSAP